MALPYKTIRYLALFFGGPHDERTSTHDLVDVLVGQKCFSKKGGSNLKAAIDLIDKIRVAARGQTRFDMRRVVKQVKEKYAARKAAEQQANEGKEHDEEDAPDDGGASGEDGGASGEEGAVDPDAAVEDQEEKEAGETEEGVAEEEEAAQTANAESEVYHLSLEDVNDLLRVYQVRHRDALLVPPAASLSSLRSLLIHELHLLVCGYCCLTLPLDAHPLLEMRVSIQQKEQERVGKEQLAGHRQPHDGRGA